LTRVGRIAVKAKSRRSKGVKRLPKKHGEDLGESRGGLGH